MKLTKILMAAIALSIGSVSYAADGEFVLKFSHSVAKDTPKGLGAEFFAKRVSELTKGRVKIEVYPNSTLYSDKDELDALQFNEVQILAPSMVSLDKFNTDFEIFDLPYLFENQEQVDKITNGKIGKDMLKKLEKSDIKGVAFWDNGFKSFSSNSKISKPEDFKGKLFSVQPSKVLEDEITSLGARPVLLSFSEVYPALQTGVIDGTENSVSNFYAQNMNEVQRYLTVSNHGYVGYAVIMNKSYLESLPKDIYNPLMQAMKEATDYEHKIAQDKNNKNLQSIKEAGKTKVYYLSEGERSQFKKAFEPVYTDIEKKIGKTELDAIYKELNK